MVLIKSLRSRFDLVDISRQALVLIGSSIYNETMRAYFELDFFKFLAGSGSFLELLDDLDGLMKTDKHFLLGPWLESAKALGTTEEQKALLEYNARIQV